MTRFSFANSPFGTRLRSPMGAFIRNAVLSTYGDLFIAGAFSDFNGNGALEEGIAFDHYDAGDWVPISGTGGSACRSFVVLDGDIYLGRSAAGAFKFDPGTSGFVPVGDGNNALTGTVDHVFVFNNELYALKNGNPTTGLLTSVATGALGPIARYDVVYDQWEALPSWPLDGNELIRGAVVYNGTLYIYGADGVDEPCLLLPFDGSSWGAQVTGRPSTATVTGSRTTATSACVHNGMLILGAYTSSTSRPNFFINGSVTGGTSPAFSDWCRGICSWDGVTFSRVGDYLPEEYSGGDWGDTPSVEPAEWSLPFNAAWGWGGVPDQLISARGHLYAVGVQQAAYGPNPSEVPPDDYKFGGIVEVIPEGAFGLKYASLNGGLRSGTNTPEDAVWATDYGAGIAVIGSGATFAGLPADVTANDLFYWNGSGWEQVEGATGSTGGFTRIFNAGISLVGA